MSHFIGKRAVVIGAGIGGLSVAAALSDHFLKVDVIERDLLPTSGVSRPGTPQDRHPHGLLAGGLRALDELLPGFARDLAKAGAVRVKVAEEVCYERPDVGMLPQRSFDMPLLCASRPLIELVLRRRVQAIRNVTLRSGCRVTKIVPREDGAAVQAVRVVSGADQWETLDADLVIDASGRGLLTLQFLDTLRRERPLVTEVGVDINYATAVVRIPPEVLPAWKLVITLPDPPKLALNAVLTPMEGDRWIALIASRGETTRPETWDSFLDALRGLTTQTLHEMLRHAEPLGNIRHYSFPASLWRHFERLPSLPRGILPVGDAICRFNPIHGQGMSSAAKQARLLQDLLGGATNEADPIATLQAAFMAKIESVLRTPWSMSTSVDLAFPTTRGERPENFEESRQFETALFRAVMVDPVVHRAVFEVSQLLQPIELLQTPQILQRIEEASARMFA